MNYQRDAETINRDLDKICVKKSKWSGKINVKNDLIGTGQKEWNCDISLIPSAEYADELHELIHARSVSYFDEETYKQYYNIEEGATELLTEELCKAKKIGYTETYIEQVKHLRRINRRAKLYVDDMEFAKELINVELPDRIEWLIKKVNANFSQGKILDIELEGIRKSLAVLMEEYKK